MHPDLENLINIALVDGELGEKEKAVIFRKAQTLGEDPDEIEMIINSKLRGMKKNVQPVAPQSNKVGDAKKCPSCNAVVPSFSMRCEDCGHEFRNIEAPTSINTLFTMLNDAESGRNRADTLIAGIGERMFMKGLTMSAVDKKKREIISSFPIPNTKEDIVEFLIVATPKSKKIGNMFNSGSPENKLHNEYVPVWKAKCEQIIMKARFALKEDKNLLQELERYATEIGIK